MTLRDTILEELRKYNSYLDDGIIRIFKTVNKIKDNSNVPLKELIERLGMVYKVKIYYIDNISKLYSLNYREEGDYENITSDNVILPYQKPKRTSNINAYEYVNERTPFEGSNLSGEWEVGDYDGKKSFVVRSYGHYPIYVYKYGEWFGVNNSYSRTTAKHMSNSRPRGKIIYLSRSEIKDIISGKITSPEEVQQKRFSTFKKNNLTRNVGKTFTRTFYSWSTNIRYRVSYTLKDVSVIGDDKIRFIIIINGAKYTDDTTPLRDNMYEQDFANELEEVVTRQFIDSNDGLNNDNTEFSFIHRNLTDEE